MVVVEAFTALVTFLLLFCLDGAFLLLVFFLAHLAFTLFLSSLCRILLM